MLIHQQNHLFRWLQLLFEENALRWLRQTKQHPAFVENKNGKKYKIQNTTKRPPIVPVFGCSILISILYFVISPTHSLFLLLITLYHHRFLTILQNIQHTELCVKVTWSERESLYFCTHRIRKMRKIDLLPTILVNGNGIAANKRKTKNKGKKLRFEEEISFRCIRFFFQLSVFCFYSSILVFVFFAIFSSSTTLTEYDT